MSMQDTIADMLTRIRNAQARTKVDVSMPSSKVKIAVAKVLQSEGYILGFSVTEDIKPTLTVELKYHNGTPVIETLKRISKPSLRVYKNCGDLKFIKGGLGIAIVSTSQGVMSDREARKLNIGGEIICEVA